MENIIIEPHYPVDNQRYYTITFPKKYQAYLLWDSDLDTDMGVYLTRDFVADITEEFGSMEAFKLVMEIEYR